MSSSVMKRLVKYAVSRFLVSRFVFDIFRLEWNAWLVRRGWAMLPHKWLQLRRLHSLKGIYLNIASGGFLLDEFTHLDLFGGAPGVIRWDCSRSLPFSDESCAGIRIEHFVEHIEPREDLPSLLRDCFRVLAWGGVLRIVVPDAGRFLRAYARGDECGYAELGWQPPFPHDLPTRMDVINHIFHQWHEHRWGYDYETLVNRLRNAGFGTIKQVSFGSSLDDKLAQDRQQHASYSLYVDAVKDF